MSDTTVVTAYYPLAKSKHSRQDYMKWIENFFSYVESPVVCFCPVAFVHTLKAISTKYRRTVHYITKSLNELIVGSKEWQKIWDEQLGIDDEKDLHSPELYIVWASKQEFVTSAIKENTFNSTYFVWCDIGCFREPGLGIKFPSQINRYSKSNWFLCLQLIGIYPVRIKEDLNAAFGIHHNTTIGGGVLAGDKQGWMMFSNAYYEMLSEFRRRGFFIGKDQTVFTAILSSGRMSSVQVDVSITNAHIEPLDWFKLTKVLGVHNTMLVSGYPQVQSNIYNRQPTLEVKWKDTLGEQLFQYASFLGLSKRYNRVATYSSSSNIPSFAKGIAPFEAPFLTDFGCGFTCNSGVTDRSYSANEHLRLWSSLENPDYFRSIREDLIQLFVRETRTVHMNTVLLCMTETSKRTLGMCYYRRAMQYMRQLHPGCTFHIITDDVSLLDGLTDGVQIPVQNMSDFQLLQSMMNYDSYILSNTELAWWAAWLCGTNVVAPADWFPKERPYSTFWGVLYEPSWTVLSSQLFTIETDILDVSFLADTDGPVWNLVREPPAEKSSNLTVWYLESNIDQVLIKEKPSTIDYVVLKDPFTIKYTHESWQQCPPAWVGDIRTPSGLHRLQTTLYTLANRPSLSVALPAYNANIELLLGSLSSIYAQTFRSWEILFGDDGSTNPTLLDFYSRIAGPQILWIRCSQNYKLPVTLNRLILFARTERIARMDADDYMFVNRFERQYTFMNTNPSVNICGTNMYHVSDVTGFAVKETAAAPSIVNLMNVTLNECFLFHPCVMYNRSFILNMGLYNERALHVEDLDLWVRILKAGHTIHNIQEVLLYYTTHGSNVSIVHSKKQTRESDLLWESIRKEQKRSNYPNLKKTISSTQPHTLTNSILVSRPPSEHERFMIQSHSQRITNVQLAKQKTGLKYLI